MSGQVPHSHGVAFYDHDGEAIGVIARYVADGLSAGECVIVIATEWHRAVLDDLLQLRGIDLVEQRSTGRYLTPAAAQTLSLVMVDDSPDATLFRRHIGGIVQTAGRDGTAVRACGEMVALLWEDANIPAALQLEALGNDLAKTHAFELLCAYPAQALDSATLTDIDDVCRLHSDVAPPLHYTAMTDWSSSSAKDSESELFLPVTESVVAARNLVAGVLEGWGESELVRVAALITSGLATNAAVGGASPFMILIERARGIIRISVHDVAPGIPLPFASFRRRSAQRLRTLCGHHSFRVPRGHHLLVLQVRLAAGSRSRHGLSRNVSEPLGAAWPPSWHETQLEPISGLDPLLSIEDLAEYLGVPVATIYDWRVDGKGPCGVRVGRHVKFTQRDVLAWIEVHRESRPDLPPESR